MNLKFSKSVNESIRITFWPHSEHYNGPTEKLFSRAVTFFLLNSYNLWVKKIVFLLFNPLIHSLCNTWAREGAIKGIRKCDDAQLQRPFCYSYSVPWLELWREHYQGTFLVCALELLSSSVLWDTTNKLWENILWVLITGQLGQQILQFNLYDWVDILVFICLLVCFNLHPRTWFINFRERGR